MTSEVPISHHLDLYHYWLGKRNGRVMPARRDIDPIEIPALLPHLSIVHKINGEFRYRLVGTRVVRDFGGERTGELVRPAAGNAPGTAAILQQVRERIFTSAQPIFAAGQYHTGFGTIHNVSVLVLPLSDDGTDVNMTIFTRVSCFCGPQGLGLRLGDLIEIHDAADLERCCLDWKGPATNPA